MEFGSLLKNIRTQLGYKTATSFYAQLSAGMQPSFNYSYYARCEAGKALPSAQFVKELTSFFPQAESEILVRAWSQAVFPNFKYLFEEGSPIILDTVAPSPTKNAKQKYLTLRQVHGVTKTYEHYQLFVVLTMARKAIALPELQNQFDFPIKEILHDLEKIQIASVKENLVHHYSADLRFPKADTDELKALFRQVEVWNKSISEKMGFVEAKEKFFIERTSLKHFEALLGATEQIDALIRMSEDLDKKTSTQVVMIEYKISTGKLPG